MVALVTAFVMGLALQGQAQSWKINYGSEKGSVAVYNSKTAPDFAEDAPYGPMALRIFDKNLWLLDSIGGKVYSFDSQNNLKTDVSVPGLEKFKLLEDFALVAGASGRPESIWVADAADCVLRKISLANGKELLRIGGRGSEPGKFMQINQIEVDAGGRLYVGDYGRTVISVFTAYGELIREMPWQRCGFALDKKGQLHLLVYRENAGYFHRIYSSRGQLLKSIHVGLAAFENPRVWSVGSDGSLMVSFVPAGGFKGSLRLVEIGEDARILNQLDFSPPGSMNRFLASADHNVFVAVADFFTAPEGSFTVKSVEWDVKK